MKKIPVTAVCGPTASGKTSLAVSLALALVGEVVSCDSMQIYRQMDIGTAKPTVEEMCGVPHHMIDICPPDRSFNVSDFVKGARAAIADIYSRGKRVIICGGTGLYLYSLLRTAPCAPDISPDVRAALEKNSDDELWARLCKVDPESAAKTHKNNRKRVIRALEIFDGTGKTKTYWDGLSRTAESDYEPVIIGLDYRDRKVLYDRIDRRVDIMFESGVCDEVKRIGLSPESTAAQAIGYKEIFDLIDGKIDEATARERVKQATRRYAKRQLTWFRREEGIKWFYPDEDDDLVNNVISHIENTMR